MREPTKNLEDTIWFQDPNFGEDLKNKIRYLDQLEKDKDNNYLSIYKTIKYYFEGGRIFLTPFDNFDSFYLKKILNKDADKNIKFLCFQALSVKYLLYLTLGFSAYSLAT